MLNVLVLLLMKVGVHLNVSFAGSLVVKVNYVKCIGVIIDESWSPHVEYVKKTVYSNLGMINNL